MPSYKLTYFNLGAQAEPIRWAFKVAEVDFEDERIEHEDWPALKKSGRFPNESLPVLEIDGEAYTQSVAILRYVGTEFGLTADGALQRLRLDQILDIISDARTNARAWQFESDPEKKEKALEAFVNDFLKLYLCQISEIIAKTEGPFITGSKLTYGDLGLAHTLNMWLTAGMVTEKQLQEEYPALSVLREAVLRIPQIKAWLEVRPKTKF